MCGARCPFRSECSLTVCSQSSKLPDPGRVCVGGGGGVGGVCVCVCVCVCVWVDFIFVYIK